MAEGAKKTSPFAKTVQTLIGQGNKSVRNGKVTGENGHTDATVQQQRQ